MKQKNYDAENLFKDYMQSVNADPTAIDDILSGERQPANHGARIKHSTGKMATVTAAAAVVAICAGIGLSNMNANDDSSVKSAATTSQTSSVLTPAKQITQSFKLEASPLQADGQLAKTTLTLTATDEDGKEIIKKYANEKSSSSYHAAKELSIGGKTANLLPEVLDSTGYHHEGDYRWSVVSISEDKVVFDFKIMLHKAAQEDIPFTVNVFMPSDKEYTLEEVENGVNLDPIIATANLTYKANTKQYEFASANGEKLTVSDVGIITHHDIGRDDDGTKQNAAISNMLFTFADGTSKTAAQLGQTITYVGGGYTNDEYSDHLIFSQPIGADKLTSITYDGITYATQQAAVTMTAKPIAVSERAFGIEIKLTAGNEEGKKLLKENAEKISSSLCIEKDGMIATAGSFFGADKLSGDSLTLRLFGNIFNKRIDTIPITIKLDSSTPIEVIKALGDKDSAVIFFKKTVDDKVFVSESGEYFWLSDNFATTDHNFSTPKTPDVIFKLKDGTEVSTRDIELTCGGNTGNDKIKKQHTFVFDGKFPKGTDNVVSIIYDGIEFTAQ